MPYIYSANQVFGKTLSWWVQNNKNTSLNKLLVIHILTNTSSVALFILAIAKHVIIIYFNSRQPLLATTKFYSCSSKMFSGNCHHCVQHFNEWCCGKFVEFLAMCNYIKIYLPFMPMNKDPKASTGQHPARRTVKKPGGNRPVPGFLGKNPNESRLNLLKNQPRF